VADVDDRGPGGAPGGEQAGDVGFGLWVVALACFRAGHAVLHVDDDQGGECGHGEAESDDPLPRESRRQVAWGDAVGIEPFMEHPVLVQGSQRCL